MIVNSGAAARLRVTLTSSDPPSGLLTLADSAGEVPTPVEPSGGDTSTGASGEPASMVSSKSDGAQPVLAGRVRDADVPEVGLAGGEGRREA